MATGAQVQAKISAKLGQLQATPRVVKLRQQTRTGGNSLLGIGGTVQTVDTVVSPQPAAMMVKAEEIADKTSGLLQPGDWEFVFAGTTSEAALREQQILFGDTEVLNIVHVEPYALNGITVAWRVIARTVQTR